MTGACKLLRLGQPDPEEISMSGALWVSISEARTLSRSMGPIPAIRVMEPLES
jgi:hypothetical protein